jgi:short-subunit dehydrogenase
MSMETVLITGASSGIGEALARRFSRKDYDLVLVARSVDKLESLAAEFEAGSRSQVWVEPADLSKPSAAGKLARRMKKQGIKVDILVNNAGVLEHGYFIDSPPSVHQGIIDLNVSGMTEMLAHFLPSMVERGRGRILNVASIGAFQPVPSLATYAATKAYVLSLTESLSEELRGTGVTVTALCPGITATHMVSEAQEKSPGMKKIPDFMISDVEAVAKEGYRACLEGEVICVPGAANLAATMAGRALPKWFVRRVYGALGRRTAETD